MKLFTISLAGMALVLSTFVYRAFCSPDWPLGVKIAQWAFLGLFYALLMVTLARQQRKDIQ